MRRSTSLITILALFVSASLATAAAKPAKPAAVKPAESKPVENSLKQSDLARKLVDALGLAEGLPEKPAEKDYLLILGGERTFRFEAEETFDRQSDLAIVRELPLFGAFSGKGWLHATTTQTAVHFKVLIPVSGKYIFKVTAKGDSQIWSVAGKAFRQSFGDKFSETSLGQVFIPAGELEFNALLPPDGAVDSFVFVAPANSPVEPLAGWATSAPLTAAALNEVFASSLGIESSLPDDSSYTAKTVEAASLSKIPQTARLTDTQLLGKPVAANWLRAFQTGANISLPIDIESLGVYRIRVRAVGSELTAGFGNRTVTKPLTASLNWVDLGTFRLPKGTNSLNLKLPPTGGVDVIEVTKKLSKAADYAAITKTGISGDSIVKPDELEKAVKLLQEMFKEKK
ncbi:MAG: hypothetical protein HXX17_05220 [Geobacteraceae bacterium]|nr:hypothetical protein [Geobacteraceae bacterium]